MAGLIVLLTSLLLASVTPVPLTQATPADSYPASGTLVVLAQGEDGVEQFQIEQHDADQSLVVWVNATDEAHSLTIEQDDGVAIRLVLQPQETIEIKFREAGTVTFVCNDHGGMGHIAL